MSVVVLFGAPAFGQLQEPLQLEGGLLSGTRTGDPAVRVFKGIPYAASPTGDLRWRAPQPPPPWDGVMAADTFSPGCIQNVAGSRPPWTEEFMHQGPVSEDCLYLNVWTAATDAGERRPVLVYIHGGGFNEGSGSVAVYNGTTLAKKGLVVVTLNYRLGVLGLLAHPELTEESPHGASGNYGLLDQVQALRWIQQNISAFGGNPDNVAVAGQSAGAVSVIQLTASPLAEGLFHRAIAQSGPGGLASLGLSSTRGLAGPLAEAEAAGADFAARRGASSIEELRDLSVEVLTAPPGMRFRPVVDGYYLNADVATIYARGEQHDVPLLTGFNADEGSAFPGYGMAAAATFRETAQARFGEAADDFLALYSADTDDAAAEVLKTAARHAAAVALERLADERARTARTPAYLYYFDRAIPWPEFPHFGAFHTAEVAYVFGNLELLDRPWEAVDRQLADVMASYWVNFVEAGDPNGEGLPEWPSYSEAPHSLLVLGRHTGPRRMPADDAKRSFFERRLEEH